MLKYFLGQSVLRSSWDQVFSVFWQRYLNPYSKHVLSEDIVHWKVTPDQKLLSGRLLTKTNRMLRWSERLFPANVAHSVYILEDSIVDPQNQTMTTFTWNINHTQLMEFGLAQFKSNVTKTMKGFEYILAKLPGEAPSRTLAETAKEAKEKQRRQQGQLQRRRRTWPTRPPPGSSSSSCSCSLPFPSPHCT
ncbi:PRELI domain-containing protein 1, mitochondrial [Lemmus lemmus]